MSAISRPYVDGLAAGVLRYQYCVSCAHAQTPARFACGYCGSETLIWRDSDGTGTVYAVSEIARAPSETFRALVPYTLVLVDLDEGARVVGHAESGVAIGDAVVAGFFVHDGRTLVRFARSRIETSSATDNSALIPGAPM